MGKLSTHVLDTSAGIPAEGIRITLHRLDPEGVRHLLVTAVTNSDGRTDQPLLAAAGLIPGQYELTFHVGEYFGAKRAPADAVPFLDDVPVRFAIGDAGANYHVPLLVTPWSYSTYRGS
ncbi:hydroxyisourate hydrolase [Phyllobacterium sp. 21LDTY02-6]|uniref:hydroxyisourate hydrolase n=1 Tax=Phyllobacterium sp. 21LDTY02-6 TaxID=2944903 RepID=UPI002021CC15|nr:hydroxyisourate hydrolase [Phyllobacterium sp. 21LDTY02-6]MCO4318429.1 hydroxyisourate hydrolase [Phyllobacterium sp. 21LDTY02-6]